MLRQGVRIAGDEFVGCRVVAALRAGHLYIEHGIVHLSHDSLTTRKHRGFGMVEERKPQVDVLPLGTLVADVAEEAADVLAFVVYEISEDVLLRDRHSVFFVRADALEEFIKSFIVQWMIDETQNAVFGSSMPTHESHSQLQ